MLAAFQDAFVALAADAELRRRFATDPESVLAGFELDGRERATLRALPGEALDRYARSLIAKRWGEVARVVPLTLRVAPGLAAYYRSWVLVHPARVQATVLSPGNGEALRAEAAMHAALDVEGETSYAAELWRFEVRRGASRCDGESRTMVSRFEIDAIADDVRRGLLPIDPAPAAVELRFDKIRVQRRRV